jgi:hypothetical protein
MRMTEGCQGTGFIEREITSVALSYIKETLDSNGATELQVMGSVYKPHASLANEFAKFVAAVAKNLRCGKRRA